MKGNTGDTMTETQMEKAKRQYEQAKARLYATKARETKLARKRDTRRKVILGGALIELSDRDESAHSVMRRLIGNLSREQDRKMFDLDSDAPPDEANQVQKTETAAAQNSVATRPTNKEARNG
jgi:hypothetical protein